MIGTVETMITEYLKRFASLSAICAASPVPSALCTLFVIRMSRSTSWSGYKSLFFR